MTSSTSPSEPDARARRFRRWTAVVAGTFFGGAALLYAVLLAVDPYDAARFPSLGLVGVSDNNLRTSHVSRARDKRFDAAIFGSSTATALDPNRLSALTGLRFTQLAFSHGDPPEILTVLDWFLRHHREQATVLLMADDNWCSGDPALPQRYPFPFWLYRGDGEYLANLLNWKTLDRVVWRVQLALGMRRPNDQAGYLPYRSDKLYVDGLGLPAELGPAEAAAAFVWIERLGRGLEQLPEGGSVMVVMTPAYYDYLPAPGTRLAARLAECKQALAGMARGERGGFVDLRLDTPDMHVREDFYDRIHYRDPMARRIEDRLAPVLTGQPITRSSDAARN